jgi:hypothetical protein
MGLTYRDFLDLTPRQFFNAVGGFVEREEVKLKESWEQTRLIIAEIRSKPVYMYKIKQVADVKRMMPFPWDEQGIEVTQEDLDRLKKEMHEHNSKIHG